MSDTNVDFAKVTQLLDAGWVVQLFKNNLGSYTAKCRSRDKSRTELTDDFTPEQAMTRLAYKTIDGEII